MFQTGLFSFKFASRIFSHVKAEKLRNPNVILQPSLLWYNLWSSSLLYANETQEIICIHPHSPVTPIRARVRFWAFSMSRSRSNGCKKLRVLVWLLSKAFFCTVCKQF
ncbi:hypothetical protein CEXT_463301 [Caerostris extrusa]|uniref:Uncharacterized protein n=1 Tax=Caerostris extrusa TaxID=172846 RepID=A0AAV4S9C9_CAEEX|nr:hypothetical protein CEXT_463301 [Caerostris extrusa]